MKSPRPRWQQETRPDADPPAIDCVVGETIRRVRVWTQEQWEATPPKDRPSPAEYVAGLGWVVAVPGNRN